MSPEFQQVYMAVARAMSEKSKDRSTKVGAVLVKPDMKVASLGFNGFPRRMQDNLQFLASDTPAMRAEKLKRMVHAEQNAIRHCDSGTTEGYHLVVTRHPCDRCALEIACTGITDVWYHEDKDYESRWAESVADARQTFEECGIRVHRVDETVSVDHGVSTTR